MSLFKEKDIRLDKKEFQSIMKEQMKGINNLELVILKSHLLIEYLLNIFIESHSYYEEFKIEDTNFQFYQKVKICELLGVFRSNEDGILEQILLLNKMRNQVAHTLKIDNKILHNFLNYYPDLKKRYKEPNSTKSIARMIKIIIHYMSGYLIGSFEVQIKIENEFKKRGINYR